MGLCWGWGFGLGFFLGLSAKMLVSWDFFWSSNFFLAKTVLSAKMVVKEFVSSGNFFSGQGVC